MIELSGGSFDFLSRLRGGLHINTRSDIGRTSKPPARRLTLHLQKKAAFRFLSACAAAYIFCTKQESLALSSRLRGGLPIDQQEHQQNPFLSRLRGGLPPGVGPRKDPTFLSRLRGGLQYEGTVNSEAPFSKPPARRLTAALSQTSSANISKPPARRLTHDQFFARMMLISKPPARRLTRRILL